jgi:hypothetical protein
VIRAVLAVALGAGAAPAFAACEPGFPLQVQAGELTASLKPTPSTIPVGEMFGLEIALCRAGGGAPPVLQRVDAEMPAHKHGMNYRPSLVAVAPGRYRAEGLMFHMPGLWEMRLDTAGGARLSLALTVP